MSNARYQASPEKLDLAAAQIRFFRFPLRDGLSRHYAVIAIPHVGDPSRAPYPLFIALNAASNWSVVRARRIWHAGERLDARGIEQALRWMSRDAALPNGAYERAALPWYLDPRKEAGSLMLVHLRNALAPLRPFDPEWRTIEMPKAQGRPFTFERPKASGKPASEIRPGEHRIRFVRPDTGRQIDLFGSEKYLRELIARYGGARQPALQFYCCPSVLTALGLTAPAAAVARLGAKEAARRGLAPVAWDRHGDRSATLMPRD